MVVSLKAFRDRYPTATLCSDVLMVKDDQFVVKVTIETPSAGISTGLSANANLEAAEDQARQRALQGLGFIKEPSVQTTISEQLPATAELPSFEARSSDPPIFDEFAASSKSVHPAPQNSPEESSLYSATSFGSVDDSDSLQTPHNTKTHKQTDSANEDPVVNKSKPIDSTPEEAKRALPISSKPALTESPGDNEPTTSKSEAAPNVLLPAPINLSDVIAQTDIELGRLGWSVEVGREHLWKTYNKRSRHELSEEELIEFLCFLESQPEESQALPQGKQR